jgi:hypothetical protein
VLDEGPARLLFRRAAGLEGALDPSLQGLEEAILGICGGLPLALQLLGGQLFEDTQVASWQVISGPCSKGHTRWCKLVNKLAHVRICQQPTSIFCNGFM